MLAGSLTWLCVGADYGLFKSAVGRHRDNWRCDHALAAYFSPVNSLVDSTVLGEGHSPTADDNSQACAALATAPLSEHEPRRSQSQHPTSRVPLGDTTGVRLLRPYLLSVPTRLPHGAEALIPRSRKRRGPPQYLRGPPYLSGVLFARFAASCAIMPARACTRSHMRRSARRG